ncbi:hypothetical protein U9M48_005813 [Paspalum notatum var. saurae]|uniref:RING-type E3 ubiquitin transferase n=1 Tax=Paspalum notatum var. saurae TaxID=547442 RepID=A0AAQ3PN54_PASNO
MPSRYPPRLPPAVLDDLFEIELDTLYSDEQYHEEMMMMMMRRRRRSAMMTKDRRGNEHWRREGRRSRMEMTAKDQAKKTTTGGRGKTLLCEIPGHPHRPQLGFPRWRLPAPRRTGQTLPPPPAPCIPCGHVYGRSCLERWLTQCGNRSAKCPQCDKRFKHKDIINLYAPEVAIPHSGLKLVSALQEISYLREKVGRHDKLLEEMSKRQIFMEARFMEQRVRDEASPKRQKVAEESNEATNLALCTSATVNFSLQNELFLDGARVISIDASNQIILASGRATAVGTEHVLTKINMLRTNFTHKIHLPPDTKAVRDMCILPAGGSAIFTSLGRKLSLFSNITDGVVLQCDLPAPGWSCTADVSSSRYIYAGLQNGMLLVFDTRQHARPLHSIEGLSKHPVHTLHSVIDSNGSRKILSASAIGPCMWDANNNQSRPHLLTGMEEQRVCISLACAPPSMDLLVASFRPKVDPSGDAVAASQVYLSQTPSRSGLGKPGHHALITRTGSTSFTEGTSCFANVSELRMSKSVIIPYGNNQHLFAYGDESLRGVRTWQLPSFPVYADLCSHQQPILDLRYAESPGGGRYLGCLSEEKLQVFRIR